MKKHIMIVCWGYSVHAKLRIEFIHSLREYKVSVASNYDYDLSDDIDLLPLTNRSKYPHRAYSAKLKSFFGGDNFFTKAKIFSGINEVFRFFADLKVIYDDRKLLIKYIEKKKVDIVWTQTLLYPGYVVFMIPKKVKKFVTFWNGDVIWWAKLQNFEKLFKKCIFLRAIKNADLLTSESKLAHEICLQNGADEARCKLIRYPGVDMKVFYPRSKAGAKKAIGLDVNKRYILCPRGLGGYLDKKTKKSEGGYINSDIIIEAASIVCQKHKDVVFLFTNVAGYHLWELHKKRAIELGVGDNVLHLGECDWDMVPLNYSVSELYLSILSSDTQPYSMLEAMASKIPVVMGDIPAIREWVENRVNGILVPPRDTQRVAEAILYTLENRDFVKNAVEINYNTVKEKASTNSAEIFLKKKLKDMGG
jgi:glycosyltransferase involved in cell wall biosynthesis